MRFKDAAILRRPFREMVRDNFKYAVYLDMRREYEDLHSIVDPAALHDTEDVINLIRKYSPESIESWSMICARMAIGNHREFRIWLSSIFTNYVIPRKSYPRPFEYESYLDEYGDGDDQIIS